MTMLARFLRAIRNALAARSVGTRRPRRVEALRVSGVNYDPVGTADGALSTLHINFTVHAERGGQSITLRADGSGRGRRISPLANGNPTVLRCAAGTSACIANRESDADDGSVMRPFQIVRFAQHGCQQVGVDAELHWLIEMEEGQALTGVLRGPKTANGLGFPALMSMGGAMSLKLKAGNDGEIVTLRSRTEAMFQGMVNEWPPSSATVTLVNGPVDYFDDRYLEDKSASYDLRVTLTTIEFLGSCPLLGARVNDVQAQFMGKDGSAWREGELRAVKLTWTPISVEHDDMQIGPDYYHVYRQVTGDGSWEQIAAVPWYQHHYIDTRFDGTFDARYLIVHAMALRLGHHYEGLLGRPLSVPSPIR